MRGKFCQCGCKRVLTEVDPKTGMVIGICPEGKAKQLVAMRKAKKTHTEKNMNHARNSSGGLIYNTARWKRLSRKQLTLEPFCAMCLKKGRHTTARVADHIIEIRDDPKLAYSIDNLQSLCHSCHNTKTADEKKIRSNINKITYEEDPLLKGFNFV